MVKNSLMTLGIIFIAWLVLPTFGPSDIIVIWLINYMGFTNYLILAGLTVVVLYNTIEGKTIKQKWHNVVKEIKGVFK